MELRFPDWGNAVPVATPTHPAAVAAAFDRHGVRCELRRGGRLFAAGAPATGIHLVVSGHLRILRGGDRTVVLHHEGPGGMLGETAVFGGFPYPATAIATEPSTCRLLPRERVMRLLADDPEAAAFFLRRLARRLHDVIDRMDRVNHSTVAARLAAHIAARAGETGRPVSLGMTQAELAEELGTVREVVVRELRRLVARGVIESMGRGRYRLVGRGS